MKLLVTLSLLFTLCIPSQAREGLFLPGTFEIKSKKKSAAIANGFYQMSGVVYNMENNEPLPDAIVTNADQSVSVKTNEKGIFRIQFPVEDSIIYFYKPGLNEVVASVGGDRNRYYYQIEAKIAQPIIRISAKPVIYVYNSPKSGAELFIESKGKLTFTYPKLNEGWTITADANGHMVDPKTDVSYPYLFWEAEITGLDFNSADSKEFNHYFIRTDTTVRFLEDELTQAGLNSRERTDFITYWGPKLRAHLYARIQFLVDENYDRIAELSINPSPESLRRVYILFEGLSEPGIKALQTTKFHWQPFDRSAYHVLEWGGTDLTKNPSEL